MTYVSRLLAASAVAVALAACASAQHDDNAARKTAPDDTARMRDRRDSTIDAYQSTVARTYFYEPGDTKNVYWYEDRRPDVWTYRPVYRQGDRVYYIERDGNVVRRVYFDDTKARSFDWGRDRRYDFAQREKFRNQAREEWSRAEVAEREWRNKWNAEHAAERL